MGVNLIHASLMHAGNPTAIISALLDDLTRARIEVRPPAMRAAAPCGRGCSRLARQAVRLNLRPHAAMCWHCQGPCTSLGHASPARRMPREQARSCAAAAGHGGAWVPRPWGLCRQRPQNTLIHGRLPTGAQVDLIDFVGPLYSGFDNRVAALRLVQKGLCDAALFDPSGARAAVLRARLWRLAVCCVRPSLNLLVHWRGCTACSRSMQLAAASDLQRFPSSARQAVWPAALGGWQQASAPRARTAEPGAAHAHLTPGMPRAARGPADPAGDAVQEERAAGARALPAVHAAAQRHATRCAARLGAGLARKMLLNCCARLPLWVLLAHQHHYTQAPSCFSAAAAAAAATEGAHMRLTRQLLALGLGRGAVSLEAWLETGRCGGTAPTAHWRAARA